MDAVLLVNYAGLNPMAPGSGIPKAGLPSINLRKALEHLVQEAGLKVVSGLLMTIEYLCCQRYSVVLTAPFLHEGSMQTQASYPDDIEFGRPVG